VSDPRPPLPFEIALVLDELESGRVLARPIADARFASMGEEADALFDQQAFLAEHLRRGGAQTQARFSLPPNVELRTVTVEIDRPGATERERRDPLRVEMACAVLPDRGASWTVVLPLELTVYVAPGENLDEIVAAEAKRHVGVWAPSPWAVLGVFPAREHRLERVTVEVSRDGLPGGPGLQKRIDEAQKRAHARAILASVARRVRPEDVRGPEPVGLEEPLAMLGALMSGTERRSVVIVGEERAGKSELVRAWIRTTDRAVYATSGAQLVAGMSGLGQWQERVRRVMEALETLDAVVWLDDLRDLFGDRSGGFVDLPSAIKPWLDEGRVRLIGELTPEAADLFSARQAGMFAHLLPVRVEGQDARAAREALARHIAYASAREPTRPSVHPSAIPAIVELTERYLPYRPFPGKAVRLYQELRSSAERAHAGEAPVLQASDVYELFSVQSGIPLFLLRDDREWRTERARELLGRRVVGQREAIGLIADALSVVKAGLQPQGKPLASFLFCGPTGVGKTELARALAELLFGARDRMVRIDMSELADPFAAERMIRGSGSEEGELTGKVRQQPFCVVLLDEIEKAHPSVFDLLLQVLGEGRLTDARGRTAYFHNAIVVMTSNLGTQHRSRRIGIAPSEDDARARAVTAVEATFRPELVNRIDRIVAFHPLDRDQIREIAEHSLLAIASRRGLTELGASLEASEPALDVLAEGGFAEAYGARALRRHLDDELAAPLARVLGRLGKRARGARIVCRSSSEAQPVQRALGVDREGFSIDVLGGGGGQREAGGVARVSALRRWAHAQLELPTVEELVERAAYLRAELSYGQRKRKKKTEEVSIGALAAELDRIQAALSELDHARTQLDAIEELALASFMSGEPGALHDEALDADGAFRRALLRVLLAPHPRHRITLAVQEADGHRALDAWLGGLLDQARAREWSIVAHVHPDRGPRPADWPSERPYGPPRGEDDLRTMLRARERDALAMLLCVKGPDAGVLLALEAGWHRQLEPKPSVEHAHFLVRPLAQRTDLEKDFRKAIVRPVAIPQIRELRLLPAVREVHADRVTIDARRALVEMPRESYWAEHWRIALEHLILLEPRADDRAALFASPLDAISEGLPG
jgi:ATP-dependent Clp protease ATP-binding subunit ClpC